MLHKSQSFILYKFYLEIAKGGITDKREKTWSTDQMTINCPELLHGNSQIYSDLDNIY